jgi:acetyltransferase-like isoleucine patch superfamily enzyme
MTDSRPSDEGVIQPGVTLGDPDGRGDRPEIGAAPTIRSGTVIYSDVTVGDHVSTGHDVLVRSETEIGDEVLLGTQTVVDGRSSIGDRVSLQTGVYVPPETTIGDRVFVGPSATLTNDRYPLRETVDLAGPTLEADASVGANATLLPGVTVGERAFVAAGAIVTDDVPPDTLAVGTPARHEPLPEPLDGTNRAR